MLRAVMEQQTFDQVDLKTIRGLFKDLAVKLDELRGHL